MTNVHGLSARLRSVLGTEMGPSRWIEIDQGTIDDFARATGDRQWIHVDPQRAAGESPFGCTVAHGMLTLSLTPALAIELLDLGVARLVINYGLNKVRFPAAVTVGSRVRMYVRPAQLEQVEGGSRLTLDVRLEGDRQEKPVCVARLVFVIMS